MKDSVQIVGGGLAGCEAALQIASRGIPVRLIEMRPVSTSEAHHTDGLAELVCSNSFRGDSLSNAVGLIKEEMRRAGSFLMRFAEEARVPAGGALAVDRDHFSALVQAAVSEHPQIELVRAVVDELPSADEGRTIIATGPLTESSLAASIRETAGEDQLYFYDAIAPIIEADSIDPDVVFAQSRYGKGEGDDYLNCPMNADEYRGFIDALNAAPLAPMKDFEEQRFFEACLPVEVMAGRGLDTLRFGPMKPVGLVDPRTGSEPHAAIQLRTENIERTAYNMVGFQTRIKWGVQKELFRTIPGLQKAVFLRFGSVHRNTFINGPKLLDATFRFAPAPHIRFAGQITGVEGYVESTAIGLLVGLTTAAEVRGVAFEPPPAECALGGLRRHVTGELAPERDDFQPSNVNWGMLPRIRKRGRVSRTIKRLKLAERSLEMLEEWKQRCSADGFEVGGFEKNDIEDAFAAYKERRNAAKADGARG